MYHRLNRPEPHSSLSVSPRTFAWQVEQLGKWRFHFLSLDEVIDRGTKIPLLERAVALTFDDGFCDNYETGFSLLIRRKIPAAVFVVVDWVGRENFLTWKEIRELSDSGITIGSHALSHRWLPDIADDQELRREVCNSKRKIEDEIGKEVKYFCYPVGGVDERVANLAQEAGYRAGFVASARPFVRIKNGFFSVRRLKVSNKDSTYIRLGVKAFGVKGMLWDIT